MRLSAPAHLACALLCAAAALLVAVPAAAEGKFDEKSEENRNELDFNPAAVELREMKRAQSEAVRKAKADDFTKQVEVPPSLPIMQNMCDIPIVYNARVNFWIDFFRKEPGHHYLITWLTRASRYLPRFRQILHENGVPTDLVYQAMVESGYLIQAESAAHAAGPWQFIAATGGDYGLRVNFWVDERRDPEGATRAAAAYLREIHSRRRDWYLTWAEYNSGGGMVNRAIRMNDTTNFWALADAEKPFYDETKNYVPKIIAVALIAKNLELFGFERVPQLPPFDFDLVEAPDATDLRLLAACAQSTEAELRDLNPELLTFITPPMDGAPYALRIPKGSEQTFKMCSFPKPFFSYRGYKVQSGESLQSIGDGFGTNPQDIVDVNRIEGQRIRVGQELVVPVPLERPAVAPKPPPAPTTLVDRTKVYIVLMRRRLQQMGATFGIVAAGSMALVCLGAWALVTTRREQRRRLRWMRARRQGHKRHATRAPR